MTPPPIIRRAPLRWLLLLGLWTVIGLSFAAQFYISSSRLGRPVSWWYAINYALADWYVFAVLSIPVVWLSRHFPVDRARWLTNVPLHIVASALFAMLFIAVRAVVAQVQGWATEQPTSFGEVFQLLLVKSFHFNVLIYWVILTAGHALNYYREAQERQLHAAELRRHLAQARLQALQMQLNPHFLFNTLHAISALMHSDVEAADRMIARLSDLLRYALESTEDQEVPLRQELAFLERYLEIEQARFGDRLVIQKRVAPETLDAQVPNLILQPILENAIRHGIEPHARRGEITLSTRVEDGMLRLEVQDNGGGLQPGHSPAEEGVGISNTRARLTELYGDQYRFELQNADKSGLIVRVIIPYRPAPASEVNETQPSLAAAHA